MKYIGIDPDIGSSGIAIRHTPGNEWELTTMRYFELFEYLKANADQISQVRVEAGWLNKKANWHNSHSGAGVSARIGNATGANHEAGRKICEMLDYLCIPYTTVKPLKKIWRKGKISHEELERLLKRKLKRTNQESRDAALLIL